MHIRFFFHPLKLEVNYRDRANICATSNQGWAAGPDPINDCSSGPPKLARPCELKSGYDDERKILTKTFQYENETIYLLLHDRDDENDMP